MRWAWHKGEEICSILIRKPQGNGLLRRLRRRWKVDIKRDPKLEVAMSTGFRWRRTMPYKTENFLFIQATVFWRSAPFRAVLLQNSYCMFSLNLFSLIYFNFSAYWVTHVLTHPWMLSQTPLIWQQRHTFCPLFRFSAWWKISSLADVSC